MSKNLSVQSIAEIDMQSSFELNVFATQDFNKIVAMTMRCLFLLIIWFQAI